MSVKSSALLDLDGILGVSPLGRCDWSDFTTLAWAGVDQPITALNFLVCTGWNEMARPLKLAAADVSHNHFSKNSKKNVPLKSQFFRIFEIKRLPRRSHVRETRNS